ncbi:MAG: class I SAM-dependent methyltransferase [Bacteroidota bacterium]
MPGNNLRLANEFATEYDKAILNNNWNGPEIIFNAVHPFLQPKSKILDLGIGTGESSKHLHEAGHVITGLDGSEKMLEQCQKKKIASEFILHDIESFPYPFGNKLFEAIISNGLFHLIHPLKPVFAEIARILKPGGIFAFTFENTDDVSESHEVTPGVWERKTQSGVLTYKYSEKEISEYLISNNFEIISQARFMAFTNTEHKKDIYFNLIITMSQ